MVSRKSGYDGPGTRKDEWMRILPPVNTFINLLIGAVISLAGMVYMGDRKAMEDIATSVNTLSVMFNEKSDEYRAATTRLVERNEDDKREIRKEIAEAKAEISAVRYTCCPRPAPTVTN